MKKIANDKKETSAKSALLQTYLTSLLCMVLCVAMFLGTTYAWFTSEVNNSNNEIYIGTLDVALYKMRDGSPVSLDSNETNEKLFDGQIRWEPGFTVMETVVVKNLGDLAFLYELSFTDGKVNGNADAAAVRTVAKNFSVYIHKGAFTDADPRPASFEAIYENSLLEEGNTWQPVRLGRDVATLADILEKDIPVFSDSMSDVRADNADPAAPLPGPNDSSEEAHTYVIALHMDENAEGEDLMGQRISLNVKLEAYQRSYEEDAFGYDYDIEKLQANVVSLGAMDIESSSWLNAPTEQLHLDAAYQFMPVESSAEGKKSPYKDYIVDFAVWADKDIKANSVALAGYYDLFCSLNDDRWIALRVEDDTIFTTDEINRENPIRLVQGLFPVSYELLCDYGNDGIGFLCGVADLSENGENAGTTLTVELRLYEVNENGEETGNYVVAGIREHKFQ